MKKLEKFLFYFFIFSIPFQIRKILFFASAGDKFVEWNSGFLYFTDLLIIGILLLAILRGGSASWRIKKTEIWLVLFFLIAALSLITSQNIGLSVYQLIKLAEFILLFLYIKYNLEFLQIKKILNVFVASGVFQALLAVVQFFNQSSLGIKHFEAGIYNANIPGVATFFVNGAKFIRAYGTTPHPNVLAIFLLLAIFCIYGLFLMNKKSKLLNILYVTCFMLCVLGLLVTFSRAVILVFVVVSLLFFLIAFLKFKKLKSKIISLFLLFAIVCSLFIVMFWSEISARFLAISPTEQAVSLRIYYNDIAISVIKEKPFLGLGLGNFVWYLFNNYQFKQFWLYQPVHNLYLLIASEAGVFGLIVFLIFIGKILLKGFKQVFKQHKFFIFYFLFLIFMVLGLIDHYLWTIQQSRLIFWIVLAVISGLIWRHNSE